MTSHKDNRLKLKHEKGYSQEIQKHGTSSDLNKGQNILYKTNEDFRHNGVWLG